MKSIRMSQTLLNSTRGPRLRNTAVWCLCCFAVLSATFVSASAQPQKLTVSATFTRKAGLPAVEFSVQNRSPDTISIAETQLPWSAKSGALLFVVSAPSGEPIRRRGVIHDYFGRPPVVNLAPGETLKGIARLSAFFGTDQPRRTSQKFLLFWHYAPRGTDDNELGNYGGWFEFQIDN
jgi:hypothetical protein